MPNDITNIIELEGDASEIMNLFEKIKHDESGECTIDFNKIIPMPDSLDIENSTHTFKGIELYLTYLNPTITYFGNKSFGLKKFNKLVKDLNADRQFSKYNCNLSLNEINRLKAVHKDDFDNIFDLGKNAVNNYLNYGATTWYEWNIINWGSEWNAYNFRDGLTPEDKMIIFDTAWSNVKPVIEKLSQMYPNILFKYRWADEDVGYNTGKIEFSNGKEIDMFIPTGGSKEAYELAMDVLDMDLEEYLYYDEKEGTYKWKYDEEISEAEYNHNKINL